MAIISEFYKRLRDLCEERNMTVNELVKILDLSSGSPTAWKSGTIPRNATLVKIADYFGVTTDYLSGIDSKKAPTNGERSVSDVKAAFFDGYGDDLSEEEKDELWEDARVYAKFKAQQKK